MSEYLTYFYFKNLFVLLSDVKRMDGTFVWTMERDGNLASRCWKNSLKTESKTKTFYQRNSFVCWNFRVSCLLSTANTQPHTIIINSHSYFFPHSYLSYQFSQVNCVCMLLCKKNFRLPMISCRKRFKSEFLCNFFEL